MNEMSGALERLRFAVRTLPGVLARFSEAESEQRPSPERWTKKEVIGHLIDSASNNHQRFVRAQIASRHDFPGYEQKQWVRLQHYQSAQWHDLIDLWRAYNIHLLHVVKCMPEEGHRATCRVGGGNEVTLAELFVDYVDHMEHHLRKMLGGWDSDLRWGLRRVADLTSEEQAALRTLSLAVYPSETAAAWPGRALEWAPAQWSVIGWNADDAALCYVGIVLREARWNERAVKIGGLGGVKTHPASRRRGFAGFAIQQALDFFHEQGDVDFGLLVCESALGPLLRASWLAKVHGQPLGDAAAGDGPVHLQPADDDPASPARISRRDHKSLGSTLVTSRRVWLIRKHGPKLYGKQRSESWYKCKAGQV